MKKDDITRPEPGSLPARISFIEQTGGSAGYYVRFKDIPEDGATGGEPERKYIPILQYETQEEALARRGAEGTARRLVAIARDPGRDGQVRRRIESLLERWAAESRRDRTVIEAEW